MVSLRPKLKRIRGIDPSIRGFYTSAADGVLRGGQNPDPGNEVGKRKQRDTSSKVFTYFNRQGQPNRTLS